MPANDKKSEVPLAVVALAFIILIVLVYFLWSNFLSPTPSGFSKVASIPSQQGQNMSGNIQTFLVSLNASDDLSILMNVIGLDTNHSQYVYACGAGFAGSWGQIGKNISNLRIYVVDGDNCTFGGPVVKGSSLSNTTESEPASACASAAAKTVSFFIAYGPSYSIFTDTAAYIFVNENFTSGCSFQNSGTVPSTISANNNITTNSTQ